MVDDSPELDSEIFNMEEFEGADWVLISDETPVDEQRRDELLETFQVRTTRRHSPPRGETGRGVRRGTRGAGGVAGRPTPAGRDYLFSSARTLHLGDVAAGDCRHCPYLLTVFDPLDPVDPLEPDDEEPVAAPPTAL